MRKAFNSWTEADHHAQTSCDSRQLQESHVQLTTVPIFRIVRRAISAGPASQFTEPELIRYLRVATLMYRKNSHNLWSLQLSRVLRELHTWQEQGLSGRAEVKQVLPSIRRHTNEPVSQQTTVNEVKIKLTTSQTRHSVDDFQKSLLYGHLTKILINTFVLMTYTFSLLCTLHLNFLTYDMA